MDIYICSAEMYHAERYNKVNVRYDECAAESLSRLSTPEMVISTIKDGLRYSDGRILFYNPKLLTGVAGQMYNDGILPFYGACWKPSFTPAVTTLNKCNQLFFKYAAMITYNIKSGKACFNADGTYCANGKKTTPMFVLNGRVCIPALGSSYFKEIRKAGRKLNEEYQLKPPFKDQWIINRSPYTLHCVNTNRLYIKQYNLYFDLRSLTYLVRCDIDDGERDLEQIQDEILVYDAYETFMRSAVPNGVAPINIPGLSGTEYVTANGQAFFMTYCIT